MEARYYRWMQKKLLHQYVRMRKHFPNFQVIWEKGMIIWYGRIQPTPLSDQYDIRINYRLGAAPVVNVLSPRLRTGPNNEPIPHIYNSGALCLYRPWANEWTPNLSIAETIVPWTYLWLYFYELWQATGRWHGGGEHPRRRVERKRRP